MNSTTTVESTHRKDIVELLEAAYHHKLISWNDGLIYSDFIKALWRTFLKHESFSEKAMFIQESIGEHGALELLASEIDLSRKK
ncbi:hypothetical protein ACJD0Z_07450 [Flavobacteriaceae bacterium M23B6Z8]